MKKILTFDCYGTLLDTSALSEKLEEIARQNGLPTERAKALFGTYEDRVMYGEPFQPYQQALTNMLSYVDMELNTTVFSACGAQLFQLHRHFAPFADVLPALRTLKQNGWQLALMSNTSTALIESHLAQLDHLFDAAL